MKKLDVKIVMDPMSGDALLVPLKKAPPFCLYTL